MLATIPQQNKIDKKVPNSEETMELPAENRTFPCKTLLTEIQTDRPYPTTTIKVAFGKGLMATQDCSVGTVLEKFEGQVLEYGELGSEDIPIVLNFYKMDNGNGYWPLRQLSMPTTIVVRTRG